MFESYLFPISYAFLVFPGAALLFTLPFLIVQYRRHGYINKLRAVVLYLFLLYLLNALFLIVLPFPVSRHNQPPEAYAQWIPLDFIQDILRETSVVPSRPSTYLHLFRERAFLQAMFNIWLLVPFGLFLRYYFRAGWVACLLCSFGLSLFFEVTQVTGIYGLFDYPYRLFDVDDLLLNTSGGMLGFVIAEWLSARLPRIDRLDEKVDLKRKRVSYTRRSVALFLDGAILLPAMGLSGVFLHVSSYFVWAAFYFIVLPYATGGRTFGKWAVRIRIAGREGRPSLRELAIRGGLLYLFLGGIQIVFADPDFRSLPPILTLPYAIFLFAVDAWFAVHLLTRLFNRNKKLFYEEKSGTSHTIT
ncbi:VanZ family protein [Paenibacillus humicola]|uniref:VanZ family protein n=1 Tax=Paenibacillus humicola TaxID=3110540 RepID=UPI00237C3D95|nr:VanZ family protein [Paenibacillus humicola]